MSDERINLEKNCFEMDTGHVPRKGVTVVKVVFLQEALYNERLARRVGFDLGFEEARKRGEKLIEINRKQSAVEELKKMLLMECPVKYYNGTKGKAVPDEIIKKHLRELKE